MQLGSVVQFVANWGTPLRLPTNSALTQLQLVKAYSGSRDFNCGGQELLETNLEVSREYSSTVIVPPVNDGGSERINVPENAFVSVVEYGGDDGFRIWYKTILRPTNFSFGEEVEGRDTKEPRSDGGGTLASFERHIMTGFQWMKDPDGTLAMRVWYRPVS